MVKKCPQGTVRMNAYCMRRGQRVMTTSGPGRFMSLQHHPRNDEIVNIEVLLDTTDDSHDTTDFRDGDVWKE